jgi:hypothetical protein
MKGSIGLVGVVVAALVFTGCDSNSGGGGGAVNGGAGGDGSAVPWSTPTGAGVPEVQVPVVDTLPALVLAYEASVGELLDANYMFLLAYQAYVEADPFMGAEFVAKVQAFTDAGDRWLVAYVTVGEYGAQFLRFGAKADGILTGPVPSPMTAINVGQLVGSTKEKVSQIEDMHTSGQIDDNAYLDALNQLKKEQLLEAAGTTLSAGLGVLGGYTIKAGLVWAGATGGVVIGGAVLGGAAVGMGVKLLWSYCTKNKSDGASGEVCGLQTIDAKVGDLVPLQFAGKGRLIIQVEGKEPVVVDDFGVGDGEVVELDFEPGDPAAGVPPGPITATPLDPADYADCSHIAGVSATPSPADPVEFEDVVVTARTIPPVAGCAVQFAISGTDGYSNSDTATSDDVGAAQFTIPGGEEGVVDTVTIEVVGRTTTVVYTF